MDHLMLSFTLPFHSDLSLSFTHTHFHISLPPSQSQSLTHFFSISFSLSLILPSGTSMEAYVETSFPLLFQIRRTLNTSEPYYLPATTTEVCTHIHTHIPLHTLAHTYYRDALTFILILERMRTQITENIFFHLRLFPTTTMRSTSRFPLCG